MEVWTQTRRRRDGRDAATRPGCRQPGDQSGTDPPTQSHQKRASCPHLILHSGLQACERSLCLCFKPPSVWDFVSEALK